MKLDLSTREYEYENKLFPVNIVFDSNAVMDWFMGYMTHYGMKPEAMDEFKRFQADVLNTISGYKLPVITLDKSTPREAVSRCLRTSIPVVFLSRCLSLLPQLTPQETLT